MARTLFQMLFAAAWGYVVHAEEHTRTDMCETIAVPAAWNSLSESVYTQDIRVIIDVLKLNPKTEHLSRAYTTHNRWACIMMC